MLSSVKMREMLLTNPGILLKLEHLEKQAFQNTANIKVIFDYLKEWLNASQEPMTHVGFRRLNEKD